MKVDDARSSRGHRSGLLARLDQSVAYRLTLLVTPEGGGRADLLRQWAEAGARRLAWLTLEANHNAPERFVADLLVAVAGLAPAIGEIVRAIPRPGEGKPWEDIIVEMINALADVPDDGFIVLDHYDVVRAQTVHRIVEMLLDYLPPRVHLVIVAEEEPPLPLARLRVRRQLLML